MTRAYDDAGDDEGKKVAIGALRKSLAAIPLVEVACIGVGGSAESPMLYVYLKVPACPGSKLPKTVGRYRVEYINGAPRPASAPVELPKVGPPKAKPPSRVGSVK